MGKEGPGSFNDSSQSYTVSVELETEFQALGSCRPHPATHCEEVLAQRVVPAGGGPPPHTGALLLPALGRWAWRWADGPSALPPWPSFPPSLTCSPGGLPELQPGPGFSQASLRPEADSAFALIYFCHLCFPNLTRKPRATSMQPLEDNTMETLPSL